jgi:hypothetical protein
MARKTMSLRCPFGELRWFAAPELTLARPRTSGTFRGFAIKANVVTNFLDANGIAYTSGSLGSTALQTSEIAERAKSLAVMIECDK